MKTATASDVCSGIKTPMLPFHSLNRLGCPLGLGTMKKAWLEQLISFQVPNTHRARTVVSARFRRRSSRDQSAK